MNYDERMRRLWLNVRHSLGQPKSRLEHLRRREPFTPAEPSPRRDGPSALGTEMFRTGAS